MSLGFEIFLKVLFYSVIIITVKEVVYKIQKPTEEFKTTELGERFIDWKIYSIIYMIGAIVFTIILVGVSSMPSNLGKTEDYIFNGIFISLILFLVVLSIFYGGTYVKIGKEKIYWRKMFGKEREIEYSEISLFKTDGMGNIKIYKEDKCVLHFAMGVNKVFVTEVLKNHKVPTYDFKIQDSIIMKQGTGYVTFDAFCILVFIVFFLATAYYRMFFGMFLSFFFIIASIFSFFARTKREITVKNRKITEKRFLRRTKEICFKEVEYLSLRPINNSEEICIHSKNGKVIRVPRYYRNVEMLDNVIEKQHWRWK